MKIIELGNVEKQLVHNATEARAAIANNYVEQKLDELEIFDTMNVLDALNDIVRVIKYTSRLEYYKLRLKQLEDALDAQKAKLNELENIRNFGQKTLKNPKLTPKEQAHIKYTTLKKLRAAHIGNAKLDAAVAEMKKLKPELTELNIKGIKCTPDKFGHKLRLLGKNYKRACELEKRINLLEDLKTNAKKETEEEPIIHVGTLLASSSNNK